FEKSIYQIPKEDFMTVLLFHRDLYVQYFIRRLNIDSVFLYDMNEDKKNIKIHMYHAESDERLLIKPQIDYAKKKKIEVTYHLFDGNYCHGSFILNNIVRQYVIHNIKKVCDNDAVNNDSKKIELIQ